MPRPGVRPQLGPSTCKRYTGALRQRRDLSASVSRLSVAPESPRFIDVPQPPQLPRKPPGPVKGVLPVPRNIFPRSRPDKGSPGYLATVTREPSKKPAPYGPDASRLEYKARMAEMRRRNLREGMTELKERKIKSAAEIHARSRKNIQHREKLINAPERDDERLTAPTTSKEILALLEKRATPKKTSVERGEERVARQLSREKAHRADAIHNLYIHAREFIVNEEQLSEAIEKTFGTDENPIVWGTSSASARSRSIWALGMPEGIGGTQRQTSALGSQESVMQNRLRRIAEAFTGGKMVKEGGPKL